MKDKYAKHLISVGKKLRAFRLARDWSQEVLASKCDTVNAAKISKMENAREDYNFSTLLEVCDALGADVSDIARYDD